jgi:hypothetical protein
MLDQIKAIERVMNEADEAVKNMTRNVPKHQLSSECEPQNHSPLGRITLQCPQVSSYALTPVSPVISILIML